MKQLIFGATLILLLLLFFLNGITLQAIVCNAEEKVSAISSEMKSNSFFVRSIEQSLVNVSQSAFLNLKIGRPSSGIESFDVSNNGSLNQST